MGTCRRTEQQSPQEQLRASAPPLMRSTSCSCSQAGHSLSSHYHPGRMEIPALASRTCSVLREETDESRTSPWRVCSFPENGHTPENGEVSLQEVVGAAAMGSREVCAAVCGGCWALLLSPCPDRVSPAGDCPATELGSGNSPTPRSQAGRQMFLLGHLHSPHLVVVFSSSPSNLLPHWRVPALLPPSAQAEGVWMQLDKPQASLLSSHDKQLNTCMGLLSCCVEIH